MTCAGLTRKADEIGAGSAARNASAVVIPSAAKRSRRACPNCGIRGMGVPRLAVDSAGSGTVATGILGGGDAEGGIAAADEGGESGRIGLRRNG